MERDARVLVLGGSGLIGRGLLRALAAAGRTGVLAPTRRELDLLDHAAVASYFERCQPSHVFFAAGRTGGVYANSTYRAEFIYENLAIQNHVIHESYLHAVRRLIFFGCSSMYPKLCPQPIVEDAVLTGPLEPTSEPFAVAKIAGLMMCESYNRQYGTTFLTLIPTSVYGPGQRYEPMNSLVVPALIRKCHEAKADGHPSVRVWGSGRAARDFIYVDDLASAALFVMGLDDPPAVVNVGTGSDRTVRELAEVIRQVVGFDGSIEFDLNRPEGVLTKLQDTARLRALGWEARTPLEDGLRVTYEAFVRDVAPQSPLGGGLDAR